MRFPRVDFVHRLSLGALGIGRAIEGHSADQAKLTIIAVLNQLSRGVTVTVTIRVAEPKDSVEIAALMHQLGYGVTSEMISENLSASVDNASDAAYIACKDDIAVGCVSLHALPLFHMLGSLGRITSLVVDEKHRGHGIGQMLVQAAERWFHSVGCVKAEVTSGDVRIDAHRFYEREGFSRDGQRLSKKI